LQVVATLKVANMGPVWKHSSTVSRKSYKVRITEY